jgi:hypothetical protein
MGGGETRGNAQSQGVALGYFVSPRWGFDHRRSTDRRYADFMNWTIECEGTEKLVADWGFNQLQRKLVSQGQDELTFVADGAAADGPSLFTPFESTITLWRDRQLDTSGEWTGGTIWFAGLVIQVPRRGAPDAESNAYKAAGPWWYLDTRVFEKTYNILQSWAEGGSPVYAQETFSHVFLNIGPSEAFSQFNMITTGAQIIEALDWALKPFTSTDTPPPFQIGTVTPALLVPFSEVRDVTCAEVIHKMLRWSPDAVTWFDYTTSPPTFNCVARSSGSLTPVSLSMAGT